MGASSFYILSRKNKILFSLVGLLGFLLYLDVFTAPQNFSEGENKGERSQVLSRSPANFFQEDSVEEWREPNEIVSLNWDCRSPQLSLSSSKVHHLQLKGVCLRWVQKIVNTNNHYTVDIFSLADMAATDFFTLDRGVNQLQIEWMPGAPKGLSDALLISQE